MSDNRSYLKNLSQKKYAWMEIAAAAAAAAAAPEPLPSSTSPVRPETGDTAKRPNDATKKGQTSPAKPRKKQRQKESAPLPVTTTTTTTATTTAAAAATATATTTAAAAATAATATTTASSSSSSSPASAISTPTSKPTKSEKHQDEPDDEQENEGNNNNNNNNNNNHDDDDTHRSETSLTPTKLDQPNFKYTTFPLKGYTILPTRNIASNFVRSDTSHAKGHKAGDEAICPKEEEEWHDTIIIHPGSRNLRIGLASEAYPITVPHVLARHVTSTNRHQPPSSPLASTQKDESKETQDALRDMRNELNWRMKNAKRRTLPNADNQVISFNSHAPKETIPDHNDPYRVEWIEEMDDQQVYVADQALRVPLNQSTMQLFYPWRNGTLNHVDYTSLYAVLGDLQTIWTAVIRSELEIEDQSFENFNAVLVVPDNIDRAYISYLITMMLQHMKFRGVIVQQASSCATFGAGVSSACVVDIGAQTTSIACVDEGVQLVDSRMTIHLGGDDITRTFMTFLQANEFPYHDLDLTRSYDWRLVEELKEKWCTMNEAELSVQVYDFFVRAPHQPTYKYQCKVYDEVFLAPLCLVYPNILNHTNDLDRDGFTSTKVVDDIADEPTTGMGNPMTQSAAAARAKQSSSSSSQSATPKPIQEDSPAVSDPTSSSSSSSSSYQPIDIAIAQSIQSASGSSDDRFKRYFTNIIIVGGGVKISNFNRVLEDRLLSTMIARTAGIDNVEILPAPRELDPEILVWKGASVLCKLDLAKDMWIGNLEWTESGLRVLRDRSLLLF